MHLIRTVASRRLLAAGVAMAAAVVGMAALAAPASAHALPLSASSACTSDGTYTVTYTGQSDYGEMNSTFSVTGKTPASSDVNPTYVNVTGEQPFTATQTGISGTARTASLTGQVRWADGYTRSVSTSITLSGTCTKPVTPASPSFADPTCAGVSGSYTIPSSTGVDYLVEGKPASAGTYPIAAGSTVTVTAAARPGYRLEGTAEWSHATTPAAGCTTTVTAGAPTFTVGTCEAPGGSYRIPATVGVDYLVNGKKTAAGTHQVAAGMKVAVTAAVRPGYVLTGVSSWTHTVTTPDNCNNPPVPSTTPTVPSVVNSPASHSTALAPVASIGAAPSLANTGAAPDLAAWIGIVLAAAGVALCLAAGRHRHAGR